uniref:HDC19402 n=1 Tax=Drosophila melanogaster TaxID=7227 RepID=Q6II90_DROME|nr:TPA_inf: HDC19402 [Drosophila melanogaster]
MFGEMASVCRVDRQAIGSELRSSLSPVRAILIISVTIILIIIIIINIIIIIVHTLLVLMLHRRVSSVHINDKSSANVSQSLKSH